jgi:hypothetical protein
MADMTIEPSDAMVHALWRALPSETQDGREPDDIRSWVATVLAEVERDYRLDRICPVELMPGVRCARPAHARGDHESKMPSGSAVTWS